MTDNNIIDSWPNKVPCTRNVDSALQKALELARAERSEFVTPEFFCKALFSQEEFKRLISVKTHDTKAPLADMESYIESTNGRTLAEGSDPGMSQQMTEVLKAASDSVIQSGSSVMDVPHVLFGILNQKDSFSHGWLLESTGMNEPEILSVAFSAYAKEDEGSSSDDGWSKFCSEVTPVEDIVGRKKELSLLVGALCLESRSNAVLVGESGAGRSTIAGALAAMIKNAEVPVRLQGLRVHYLHWRILLSGSLLMSEAMDRMRGVLASISESGHCILVIPDIHQLIGGKQSDGFMDLSGAIIPSLLGGNIHIIGITTPEDYKKSIGRSHSMERLFRRIDVEELGIDDAVKVLERSCGGMEDFHRVKYPHEAVLHAVKLGRNYSAGSGLLLTAKDILDLTGAYMERDMEGEDGRAVDCATMDKAVGEVYGAAVTIPSDFDVEGLQVALNGKVFGQEHAVAAVCDAVFSSLAGLTDPRKPMASLLFVGSSGTGKTMLVKELGEALGMQVQRFDMSEYSEKYTVSKLIGAPAGYVGYDEGGLLTGAVMKTPNCIILLDEIEKAHPDIYNVLLQVMDYGTLTDTKGRKVDFTRTIIIMTSNAGARYASQPAVGFNSVPDAGARMGKALKGTFAPEFLNRLTATVKFNGLTRETASAIVDAKIDELGLRLKDRGVEVSYTVAAKERILDLGFSAEYGAREIERTLNACVRTMLVKEMLFGFLKDGGAAEIDFRDGAFRITGDKPVCPQNRLVPGEIG